MIHSKLTITNTFFRDAQILKSPTFSKYTFFWDSMKNCKHKSYKRAVTACKKIDTVSHSHYMRGEKNPACNIILPHKKWYQHSFWVKKLMQKSK
jgi:hypothetical protein